MLEHIIYGPTCVNRKDLPCFDPIKKVCTLTYPKHETEATYIEDKGVVYYKRSKQNTASIKRANKHYTVSDCDVVPYNPAIAL